MLPLVGSDNAHTAVTAVVAKPKEQFERTCSLSTGGSHEVVTPVVMSSLMRVSVAVNLNIYSSSNVMNSIPANKGNDGPCWTIIIPSLDVCYCKSTYP